MPLCLSDPGLLRALIYCRTAGWPAQAASTVVVAFPVHPSMLKLRGLLPGPQQLLPYTVISHRVGQRHGLPVKAASNCSHVPQWFQVHCGSSTCATPAKKIVEACAAQAGHKRGWGSLQLLYQMHLEVLIPGVRWPAGHAPRKTSIHILIFSGRTKLPAQAHCVAELPFAAHPCTTTALVVQTVLVVKHYISL